MTKRTRLTVALDDDTYQALRKAAFHSERTHQEILEKALKELLAREGVADVS